LSSDITTNTGYITLSKPTECLQTDIKTDIETITIYLVKERALKTVQATLGQISNVYKKYIKQKNTEQTICQLETVVQKLADKVNSKLYRPIRSNLDLYTAVARQRLSI
jgi:thymidylate synthase